MKTRGYHWRRRYNDGMQRKPLVFALCAILGGTAILTGQRERVERPVRYSVRGTRGAVAAGTEFASEAAMRIFHRGGNAVDAGVAAMFAASITEYSHFGFGGEAPILIRTADGHVLSIAGVGTMPKLATAQFFRTRRILEGDLRMVEPGGLKGIVPVAGLLPALVPGMVDAGLVALREFGTVSFADAIAPAIDLADGAPLDEIRAGTIMRERRFFSMWPTSKATFLPDGSMPRPGEIFRQPNLAKTMRAMAAAEQKARSAGASRAAGIDAVRDFFYRGDVARKIDAFCKANEGLLRYEDMAAFRLKPEEPASTTYRGYKIHKPGFWSQGPVLLQALNILEGFDLASLPHNSADYLHRVVEAMKLSYADRDTYYGDPAVVSVPAEKLLSKEYAAKRRAEIGARASLEFKPGIIDGKAGMHPSEADIARARIDDELMARDTTGINTIDKSGIMFAVTPSGAWLPSVIAGDTGIPLTQRAQSFLLTPGHPNELAGGKRPRVTLSPTLVTRDGLPVMTLSTPGGDNQDQALLQVLLNVLEFGMNSQAAVEAPRFQTRHLVSSFDNHAMNRGDLLLDERIAPQVFAELSDRGHHAGIRSRWNSGAHPVTIRVLPNGVIEAGADPWGYRSAQAW
jgi:gamma-glutamyltranspeptidase / glutathione hydrolase